MACSAEPKPQEHGELKILVWDTNGKIAKVITKSNVEAHNLKPGSDLVILSHSLGESSCSTSMKKLIKSINENHPKKVVVTIDYSKLVS